MAERIGRSLNKALTVEATELFMSASIGIGVYPEDGADVSELMQNGDAALYQAREAGGNSYRHSACGLTDHARERVTLTSELNRAIERFGTGYSSLAYLKGLPFDTLKIDRGFISGLPDDPASAAIGTAITTLGDSLGFDVLAEGVETEAQRRFLLGVSCRQAQGYLFSPPVPPETVVRLLS